MAQVLGQTLEAVAVEEAGVQVRVELQPLAATAEAELLIQYLAHQLLMPPEAVEVVMLEVRLDREVLQ